MTEYKSELIAFLIREQILTSEQGLALEEKSAKSGEAVEAIIIKEKALDEETLAKMKGKFLGFPFIDLTAETIDPAVLNIIPKSAAQNYQMIPFKKVDQEFYVAFLDPKNFGAIQALNFLSEGERLKPKIFITSPASFQNAFQRYEVLRREVAEMLEVAKERFAPVKEEKEEGKTLEETIKGAPVSRIVTVMMRHAVDGRASDIHVEPINNNESRIRFRIDGVLRTSILLPGYLHPSVVARIKVLANLKIDETRIPQDGRISETIDGKNIDFRVSTLPLREGLEKVVLRILDTSVGVPTLEELGFRKDHIAIIERNNRLPHGLFLISGPTGSGKSTTLYTVLNMINKEGSNIVTLEDPIEYYMKGVNQSQIRPEVDYTFATGLRALLRQDPNVIMVGEIRDRETAELAVHAALTGHLIFSTIHTNDAFGVIPRFIDMGVEPFLLAATLNVAIAQRLARRICEHCKSVASIPKNVEENMRKEIMNIPSKYLPAGVASDGQLTFFKGTGCLRCNQEGYKGRVSVAEILQVTDNLKKIIVGGAHLEDIKEEAKGQAMITIRQDTLLKALEGSTTVEEVLRVSQE